MSIDAEPVPQGARTRRLRRTILSLCALAALFGGVLAAPTAAAAKNVAWTI